jgi:hypothetical protein
MTKQPASKKFDNILEDVAPRPTALPKKGKPKQLNIPIDADLKKLLDRAVYHKGKKTNQLLYVTQLIAAAVQADPDSQKPIPGEDD